MTRQDFIDNVNTYYDLVDFCQEIDYYVDGIYSEDERDDLIYEEIIDMVRSCSWNEIKNYLDDMPEGYDYYYKNEWGEWIGYDYDQIDEFKELVLDYADENDLFDRDDEEDENDTADEEDEPEESEEAQEEDNDPVELGCDMGDFLTSGNSVMEAIRERADADKRAYDFAMQRFLNMSETENISR